MGWLDTWWRRSRLPSDAPPVVEVDAPDSVADHEALVRRIAALAHLRVSVEARWCGDHVRVTLQRGSRRRAVSHLRHGLDLPRLLAALDALLPEDDRRRFVTLEHTDEKEPRLVTFASAADVRPLLELGWRAAGIELGRRADTEHLRPGYKRWPDGSLKEGVLAVTTTIAGVPCAQGTLVRFVDGFLVEAVLAAPVPLVDLTLPAGSQVFFHHRSSRIGLARLGEEVVVAERRLPVGTEIALDELGSLVWAKLEDSAEQLASYRERPLSRSYLTVPFRNGRWELETPSRRT